MRAAEFILKVKVKLEKANAFLVFPSEKVSVKGEEKRREGREECCVPVCSLVPNVTYH